jgi:DNA-binding Lrp family transcriptional regulator
MTKEKNLTLLDKKIIDVFAGSKSITEVAQKANCSTMSIYRALKKTHVKEELSRREQDVTNTIREAFVNGIDKLETIISDPDSTKTEMMKAFREVRKTMEFMALKMEKDTKYEEMSDQELQSHQEELEAEVREYEQETKCYKML